MDTELEHSGFPYALYLERDNRKHAAARKARMDAAIAAMNARKQAQKGI